VSDPTVTPTPPGQMAVPDARERLALTARLSAETLDAVTPTPPEPHQDAPPLEAAFTAGQRWGRRHASDTDPAETLYATANTLGDWLGSSDLMADEISDHGIDVILRWLRDRADSLAAVSAAAPDEREVEDHRLRGGMTEAQWAEAGRRETLLAQAWEAAQARYPGESGLTDASRGAFIVGWSSAIDTALALAARPAPTVNATEPDTAAKSAALNYIGTRASAHALEWEQAVSRVVAIGGATTEHLVALADLVAAGILPCQLRLMAQALASPLGQVPTEVARQPYQGPTTDLIMAGHDMSAAPHYPGPGKWCDACPVPEPAEGGVTA
jgi:hypothetical protein